MTQEEFEKIIIEKLIEGNSEIAILIQNQFRNATFLSRKFTGVGFFTEYSVPDSLRLPIDDKVRGVLASYEEELDLQMFILWITDGKISTLEGATFGSNWNNDYDKAEITASEEKYRFRDVKYIDSV